MTFEGLAFSEFGKSAFCVYLRGSQERAGCCLSLVSYRSSLQRLIVGYVWRINSDEQGGWWLRRDRIKYAIWPFTKTSIQ